MDDENHRAAWVYAAGLPSWALRTERWQTLLTVEIDGKTVTRYESREVFNGIFGYIVKFLFQAKLKLSFDAMAEGLKQRAEGSTQ